MNITFILSDVLISFNIRDIPILRKLMLTYEKRDAIEWLKTHRSRKNTLLLNDNIYKYLILCHNIKLIDDTIYLHLKNIKIFHNNNHILTYIYRKNKKYKYKNVNNCEGQEVSETKLFIETQLSKKFLKLTFNESP